MITTVIEWLKEYGDVLGGIGSITALTMLLITNGRVIMQRIKGTTRTHQPTDTSTPDHGDRTAIAVLPHKILGDVDSHFGEGLLSDLVADFKSTNFAVVTPHANIDEIDNDLDVSGIVARTGAHYILTTTVRQHDNTRRVTSQLVDINAAVIWSSRYDASGSDHITIQERIASEVTASVSTELAPQSLPDVVLEESTDPALDTIPSLDAGFSLNTGTKLRNGDASPKSRFIALLLCLIVGIFGVHRYYLGRPFTGILYTLTLGLATIGWLLDLILILAGMFADGKGRPVRYWTPDRSNGLETADAH